MTTPPRTKPVTIARTFPGTEPPDDGRDVVLQLNKGLYGEDYVIGFNSNNKWFQYGVGRVGKVRRWAELPTFPKQKGKKS